MRKHLQAGVYFADFIICILEKKEDCGKKAEQWSKGNEVGMVKRGRMKYVKSIKREKECNRKRGKMFINEIKNIRKIESMGNVRNLKLENVKDVNWNERGGIVGEGGM